MSDRNGKTISQSAIDNIRPWHLLATLGVTEGDLTTVHHRPVPLARVFSEVPGERRHRAGREGA